MKKSILLFSLLMISSTMLAQVYYMTNMTNKFENIPDDILSNIDKMGLDECLLLSKLEGEYFNALYQIEKQKFNLCDKKVCFLTGSLGKNISNKKMYFAEEMGRLKSNYSPNSGTLYIFSTTQKEESGGYDAAIVYWCKALLPVEKVIKRLKEQR